MICINHHHNFCIQQQQQQQDEGLLEAFRILDKHVPHTISIMFQSCPFASVVTPDFNSVYCVCTYLLLVSTCGTYFIKI